MAAKDRRLYARFDIGMDEHPKVMLLSDAAFRALIESTMYARRQLTDGFLDERIVAKKWGVEVAKELASNASDRPSWLKVDGGYQIHDFGEHQVTSADIEAKREAGRAGGLAKAKQAASTSVAPASKVPKQNASKPLAKTETETETLKRSAVVKLSDAEAPDHEDEKFLFEEEPNEEPRPDDKTTTSGYPDDFKTFWNVYPRRGGKGAACTAFLKAKKRAPVEAILAGAERMKNDPNLPADGTLVALPATWLNQDRWEDDPLPPRLTNGSDQRLARGFQMVQQVIEREAPSNKFPEFPADNYQGELEQ